MKKHLLILGMAFSPLVFADNDLSQLQNLFEQGRSDQAYQHAQSIADQYEGDPRFDYYYGAAAIDAGDASNGVFALERVLLQEPDNNAARLELARGYYVLEEYARARQEFETVMENNPPESVSSKVEEYLDAIRLRESRYSTTSQLYFRTGFGTDSNVNAASSDNFLLTPIGNFIIRQPNNIQETDSTIGELELGANVVAPISKSLRFNIGTRLNAVHNADASNFNNEALDMFAGLNQRLGDHSWGLRLSHQAYILDSDFYRNASGLSLQYQYQLNPNQLIQSFVQGIQTDYDNTPNRDSETILYGASFIHQFTAPLNPVISASAYTGKERPEKNTAINRGLYGRDITGISLSSQLQLAQKTSLSVSTAWQKSKAPTGFLNSSIKKDEDYINYKLSLTQLLSKRWKTILSASRAENDSNINVSSYDRNRFMLNFIYEN